MAFDSGVSLSPSDLMGKIEAFAGLNGWTTVRNNGLASSGTSLQLSISDPSAPSTSQFNMVAVDSPAADAEIRMQPSTGDGGAGVEFFNHTGSPNTSGNDGTYVRCGHGTSSIDQGFSGSHVAYFIFGDNVAGAGRYIHVVVEGVAGIYFHLFFGNMVKAGAFTGGQYATGLHVRQNQMMIPFQDLNPTSRATQWLRADAFFGAGGPPNWHDDLGWAFNQGSTTNLVVDLYKTGLIDFSGRTPFGPNLLKARDGTSIGSPFVTIGHTIDLRLVCMDGRQSGEVLTIGGDDWHIYPAHKKKIDSSSALFIAENESPSFNTFNTRMMGYALRKIP